MILTLNNIRNIIAGITQKWVGSNFYIYLWECFLVPNYMSAGDIQSREMIAPAKVTEDATVNDYRRPEELIHQIPETEEILEDNFEVHSNGAFQETDNIAHDLFFGPMEESIVEPQKHTYASIVCNDVQITTIYPEYLVSLNYYLKLQVAKVQSIPPVPQPSLNKSAPPEQHRTPETLGQPSVVSSNPVDRSGNEILEETSAMEDDGDVFYFTSLLMP